MPDINLITTLDSLRLAPDMAILKQNQSPPKSWNIRASPVVARSLNPIRSTLASITSKPPTTSKSFINLGLGDPTHYPLHPPPPAATSAICDAVMSEKANGYLPGPGTTTARQAVAEYHERWDGVKYSTDNIVLTHGVAQALDLIFSVLIPPYSMEPSNILLPKPGFAMYASMLGGLGAEVRYYDCVEENDWEVDLEMIDRLCDNQTRAIMVTNPSNPCGSNFSLPHLHDILALADKHKIPLIADEIYGHMTWTAPFIPLASLSTSVPIITFSGLSKRFLLPGWRFGWAALYDPLGVAGAIRDGMAVWSNRFFGPCSLTQAALPVILQTGPEWFEEVLGKVQTNAEIMYEAISSIPGLSCSKPAGALYVLVRVDGRVLPGMENDVHFSTALYQEEAVFVLPGLCFDAPGYFRVVIASPEDVMRDMVGRLRAFCARHEA